MTNYETQNPTHNTHIGICEVFEEVVKSVDITQTLVAHVLVNTVQKLHKEGVDIRMLQLKHFLELFDLVSDNVIAKEAIEDVLRETVKRQEAPVAWEAKRLGLLHHSQTCSNTCQQQI